MNNENSDQLDISSNSNEDANQENPSSAEEGNREASEEINHDAESSQDAEADIDAEDDEDADSTDENEKPKKELPASIRRKIAKLSRKAREADFFAQQLYEENLRLKQGQQPEPSAAPNPVLSLQKPKRDDFQDDVDYQIAVMDYRDATRRVEKVQSLQAQHQDKLLRDFQERAETLRDDHDDFEIAGATFIENSNTAMQDAVLNSELGPQLVYHLGKNPAEAKRLARLHPVAAIKEIGRIEEKLSVEKSKTKISASKKTLGDPKLASINKGHGAVGSLEWLAQKARTCSVKEFSKLYDKYGPPTKRYG